MQFCLIRKKKWEIRAACLRADEGDLGTLLRLIAAGDEVGGTVGLQALKGTRIARKKALALKEQAVKLAALLARIADSPNGPRDLPDIISHKIKGDIWQFISDNVRL